MNKIQQKIILWIATWAVVMLAASCSEENFTTSADTGDEITIRFGVELPDLSTETRAFGEVSNFDPTTASIKILSFDENHLLTNVYQGSYLSTTDGCNYYTVTLKKSDQKRILHVIVNHNDLNISEIPYGLESDIFNSNYMVVGYQRNDDGSLKTTTYTYNGEEYKKYIGTDVYWARLELDEITDAEALRNVLSHIKLIRNFAKITFRFDMDEGVTNPLTDAEWGLMGISTKATVAPYISGQTFANYFQEDGSLSTYTQLLEQNYIGNVPRSPNDDSFYALTSISDVNDIVWHPVDVPLYAYENEGVSSSSLWKKTAILLRAHYDGGTNWVYYRISLVDHSRNNDVLNGLRNLEYAFTVTRVNAEGFSNIEEAYSKAASNNISGSTNTSSYTSINLGSMALRVEYITKYILSPTEFTMRARYVPDVTSIDNNNYKAENNYLTLISTESYSSGESTPDIVGTDHTQYCLQSWSLRDVDTLTNYRNFVFKPNIALTGERAVTNKIRVAVTDNTRANTNLLYRDVTFILRERYKMQNFQLIEDKKADDADSSDEDNCFTVTVDVPSNLPQELFPLDFTFEAYPPCVYPNVKKSIMEVNGVDASIFDQDKTNSFHFHREVSWKNFNNVLTKHGSGGFTQSENGAYKQITFFFKVDTNAYDQYLEDNSDDVNSIMRIGVFCNTFSPYPDEDVEKTHPQFLEGYFQCTKGDDRYYHLTPTDAVAGASSDE